MGYTPRHLLSNGKIPNYKIGLESLAALNNPLFNQLHIHAIRGMFNAMSQSIKRTIHTSYSLLAFARKFGPKMQVGSFTNQESGDQFKSCIFTQADDTHTFVGFSSNLGELTPAEIAAQKNDLQVVEFEPDDKGNIHYSLCKKGQNNWQDVNLGL